MSLMTRSANDQLGGKNNGKAVHKENTKKCEVVTRSFLGAGKRYAASGRVLQAESATSAKVLQAESAASKI